METLKYFKRRVCFRKIVQVIGSRKDKEGSRGNSFVYCDRADEAAH